MVKSFTQSSLALQTSTTHVLIEKINYLSDLFSNLDARLLKLQKDHAVQVDTLNFERDAGIQTDLGMHQRLHNIETTLIQNTEDLYLMLMDIHQFEHEVTSSIDDSEGIDAFLVSLHAHRDRILSTTHWDALVEDVLVADQAKLLQLSDMIPKEARHWKRLMEAKKVMMISYVDR